jgi:monomeric isocitrate dehydrogenase
VICNTSGQCGRKDGKSQYAAAIPIALYAGIYTTIDFVGATVLLIQQIMEVSSNVGSDGSKAKNMSHDKTFQMTASVVHVVGHSKKERLL